MCFQRAFAASFAHHLLLDVYLCSIFGDFMLASEDKVRLWDGLPRTGVSFLSDLSLGRLRGTRLLFLYSFFDADLPSWGFFCFGC